MAAWFRENDLSKHLLLGRVGMEPEIKHGSYQHQILLSSTQVPGKSVLVLSVLAHLALLAWIAVPWHTPKVLSRNFLFDTTTAPLYAHLARSRRCGTIFIGSALNRYAFCTSLAEIALLMAHFCDTCP